MFVLGGAYLCSIKFSFIIKYIWTMSKCTLFFSRCVCAITLALLSSIFAQASELDSVRTLNLDPNLVWDKISPTDYELSEDSLTLVRWINGSTRNLDMEQECRNRKKEKVEDSNYNRSNLISNLKALR